MLLDDDFGRIWRYKRVSVWESGSSKIESDLAHLSGKYWRFKFIVAHDITAGTLTARQLQFL